VHQVVSHKYKSSDYGVIVPELPGCFSAGETMEEALTSAVEAIECHIEGLLLDGDEISQARPVEIHIKNRSYAGGTWALVGIDLSRLASKTKRINITMPERVLTLVDEQAKREGETRSGLLARAVMEYIGRHKERYRPSARLLKFNRDQYPKNGHKEAAPTRNSDTCRIQ